MAGNKLGGSKARATQINKYGLDYYHNSMAERGRLGGKAKVKKGFAIRTDISSECGRKGGRISRRKPAIKLV